MAVSLPPILSPGQRVHVRFPHLGALPATVEATGGEEVVASLAVPEPRVARLHGADVIVEWTTARGIGRLLGQLELVPARADLVRVAVHGNVERIQRREWARVEAAVPVRVHTIEEDVGGETVTLNVSGGGVLLKDHWQLPLGADVQLELLIDPAPVRALGRVVREAARDEKGVRIDSIARADEERLLRFVRERERAEMRAARGL
jgi:c-di-GMP-binding flagellar brake protein YcgR